MGDRRLLIVGNRGGTNVGQSLEQGALRLQFEVEMRQSADAMKGPTWVSRVSWHLLGRRPTGLGEFSARLVRLCEEWKPRMLLTTGQAPVSASALRRIGELGIRRANFLTDDPWNPAHRARWFFSALPHYDHVFTPRRGNMEQLREIAADISYLPFGYDPDIFFPVELKEAERAEYFSQVIFAGGADADRVPYIDALYRTGLKVGLYGSYWERFPETRHLTRGQIGPVELRKAIAGSQIAICLVRRANRDGHSMRTFEVPAVGAAMLVEDTQEHRDIFGDEGAAVLYFRTPDEMVDKSGRLVEDRQERSRLAQASHELVTTGRNTYQDRLQTIWETLR
jgi:hypothetical protein